MENLLQMPIGRSVLNFEEPRRPNSLLEPLAELQRISVIAVHLGDLVTPEFLSRHSRFAAEDEMFEASGFRIQSSEDFAAIPDDAWDQFIALNTTFSSWRELLAAAQAEWLRRQL